MQETFAKEGLNYSMEGKTGSTLNSHRLIALAGQQGLDKQDKLVELLFRAYFTQVQQHMLSFHDYIPVSAVGLCMPSIHMAASVINSWKHFIFMVLAADLHAAADCMLVHGICSAMLGHLDCIL